MCFEGLKCSNLREGCAPASRVPQPLTLHLAVVVTMALIMYGLVHACLSLYIKPKVKVRMHKSSMLAFKASIIHSKDFVLYL